MAEEARTEVMAPKMRKSGFWSGRSGLEKALLAALGVCGLAMVAGGSYWAVNNQKTPIEEDYNKGVRTVKQEDFEVCTTPECALAAARIIEGMDLTVDPCQDFFQYACGQWIENNPIPDSESRWGTFDVLDSEVLKAVRKAIESPVEADDPNAVVYLKDMNKACNDLAGIEAAGYTIFKNITSSVNGLGGWPMIQKNWASEKFTWETSAGLSRAFLNQALIFNTYVFLDTFDASTNVIHVDQTSLALPRDFYLDTEGSYDEYIQAYKNFIVDVAVVMTREAGENVPIEELKASAEDLYAFEKQLARFSVPEDERRNSTEMYNPMTVKELQEKYPINWMAYLTHVFGNTDVEITEDERIILIEPEFLHGLLPLLIATPERVQADYMFWRNVMDLAAYGPKELGDIQFKFASTLYGTTQAPPRWSVCVSNSASDYNGFGFAVAHEYIKENFNEQAKQEADEMVTNLRTAFKELVGESLWMDLETQGKAKEKVDLMLQLLGYPEWVASEQGIDEFYNGVRKPQVDSHTANVVGVKTFVSSKELESLRMTPDREFWFMNPATVNAWYSPNHNSITFPAAILHPPFFRQGNPRYLNYGAIGVVIGHEITHGFDDQGRQYDGNGNAEPWWSESTIDAFTKQAQCFIDMYSNYTVPELEPILGEDAHLNGVLTQGENIADNGGLHESYRAYRNSVDQLGVEPRLPGLTQYTPDQLFFVGYAQVWCQSITPGALLNQVLGDPHSPARYRVLGPLSNSPDFIDQFQCKAGTPMNRPEKCVLW